MPLPAINEVAQRHLFSDRDKMVKAGLSDITINHVVRLRDMYNHWLNFPSKRDRDIVAEIRQRYGVVESVAREDLRIIKELLGDYQRQSKDYHRYRFLEMINRAYAKADAANNTRDMVAAASQYAKYTQLDKEDDRESILSKVVPIVLSFTDDPEVIGIKRMPHFREKIKALKEKYYTMDQTEDVDYEDIDARLDDLFKPIGNGYADSASISQ